MKRFALAAIAAVAVVGPGVAAGRPPSTSHARAYERAYRQVAHRFGRRAPGRNLVKDGFSPHRPATDAQTVASLTVLERMLAPAPGSAATAVPAAASSQSAPAATSGGSGAPPACASESGSNYSTGSTNTNGSSGATGRYQITPSTAAAYGCSLATPAGQDACAQTIYRNQGASAWAGCG
jgi:Transglycosylase-like domain